MAVQKPTHRTTQKHVENKNATDIYKTTIFCVFQIFIIVIISINTSNHWDSNTCVSYLNVLKHLPLLPVHVKKMVLNG